MLAGTKDNILMGKNKDSLDLYKQYLPERHSSPGVGTVVVVGGGIVLTGWLMIQLFQLILAMLLPIAIGGLAVGGAMLYYKYR